MSKRPTLIQGGRVLDPATDHDATADVLIGPDGRIVAVGPSLSAPEGAEVIDATGLVVMPGFIDLHVHFQRTFQPSIFPKIISLQAGLLRQQ